MDKTENYTREQDEIMSKVLRAGRRTYFFDVRETRAGDYYLTITESKKTTLENGSNQYKKHKIYLYKEDFENFRNVLNEAVEFIFQEKGPEVISEKHKTDFEVDSSTSDNNKPETDNNDDSIHDLKFEDI